MTNTATAAIIPGQTDPHHKGKDILMLCHRVPYPPNKGDKIRSYHILRHLARQGWRVHLAALADDPRDLAHYEALRPLCASMVLEPISGWRKPLSPWGVLKGTSLSVECFRNQRLQRFVDDVLARGGLEAVLAVSAPMAEYLRATKSPLPPRMILDMVDVDSEKWRAYAERDTWPMSWLYALEARLLGRYEQLAGDIFGDVVLVSEAEAALFRSLRGEGCRVWGISNGVDLEYFSSAHCHAPTVPYRMIFCGAMDYPPNIDAVSWFVNDAFPKLRASLPQAEFWIVGSNPSPEVLALKSQPNVHVTGAVEDVRPFVGSAVLSVAPLRVARGLQNKVLEAMSMSKAVLATPQAFDGIEADSSSDLTVATADPNDFANAALALLTDGAAASAMGARARRCMEQHYSWETRLAPLELLLDNP